MNNYLLIRIKNISIYKVVKKFFELNISIINIKNDKNDVMVKILASDEQKISKYLKAYDIEIVDYYGKKRIKLFFKKYMLIIMGFVLSLFIIILSSFLIVDINVIHEDEKLVNLILDELANYNVKKFTIQKKYEDLEKIKKLIKSNHLDKIEWLEITKVGMKYVVRVEERIITKTEKGKEYCHVISLKDGLIKKINVYDGEGVVGLNEYVKKGDILISGDVKLNENTVSYNCAKGDVYAEVWYTVNVKVPMDYTEKKYTGKKRNNLIINYDGVDHKIFKDRLTHYDKKSEKIFDLLGIKIYVESENEYKNIVKHYDEQMAINKALEIAREKVNLKLKNGDKVINEKVLQNSLIDSTMNIDIFIITEENIGSIVEVERD